MYTVVIFVVASLAAASFAHRDECKKLEHPLSVQCCKKYNEDGMKEKKMEEFKECLGPPSKPPPSCDTDICIAKKRGYLGSDAGTIDMSLFEAFIVDMFKDYPDLVEAIKKECIEGDLINYGPAGACDLIKMKMCSHKQMSLNCPEWDEKGHCKDVKDLAEKCKGE